MSGEPEPRRWASRERGCGGAWLSVHSGESAGLWLHGWQSEEVGGGAAP